MAALKRGLDTIVPTQLLSLFTPEVPALLFFSPHPTHNTYSPHNQELELSVCGRPDIDLEILKKNTKYSGCSETTKEVILSKQQQKGVSLVLTLYLLFFRSNSFGRLYVRFRRKKGVCSSDSYGVEPDCPSAPIGPLSSPFDCSR